jgi:hypothetical protein
MAREESEREDLLREATALVERVEFILPGANPAVAGFRPDGAFSVFFGEDPAYHFNAAGELRRAYCDGLLIKATNGRLASLRRERTKHETQLVRHELTVAEQEEFVAVMNDRLQGILASLASESVEVVRQIPQDSDVLARVRAWLTEHQEPTIASRPNVSG